jgi:hypothetical protein
MAQKGYGGSEGMWLLSRDGRGSVKDVVVL